MAQSSVLNHAYELAIAMTEGISARVPKRALSAKYEAVMKLPGTATEKDLGELHGDIELEDRVITLLDEELRLRGTTISSANYELAKTAVVNNIHLAYLAKEYGLTVPEFKPIKILTEDVKKAGDAFESYFWFIFEDGVDRKNVNEVVEWVRDLLGPTIRALLDLLQDRP